MDEQERMRRALMSGAQGIMLPALEVPQQVEQERAAVQAEGRAVRQRLDAGDPHDQIGDAVCALLDRLVEASRGIGGDHADQLGWRFDEEQALLVDIIGAQRQGDDGYLLKAGRRQLFFSDHGDQWAWMDDSDF